VTAELRALAEQRGVRLELRADEPVSAAVDAPKIVQVLHNLIGNALKFTPPGGQVELALRGSPDGFGALITVEDSGCGPPPGDAEAVSETWHQTHAGRARGGTGLGLAIARAIVEAHGGSIGAGARSDGERGARFWFSLPAAPPGLPAAADCAV